MAIDRTPPGDKQPPVLPSTPSDIHNQLFVVTAVTGAGTPAEYTLGDVLKREVIYTGTTVDSTTWYNLNSSTTLTVVPPGVDIAAKPVSGLTNAELRQAPVEVIVTNQPTATGFETIVTTYTAKQDDSTGLGGYLKDDIVQSSETVDTTVNPTVVVATEWKNITQSTVLTAVDTADLVVMASTALTNAELRANPVNVNSDTIFSELYTANTTTANYDKDDIIRRTEEKDHSTDTVTVSYYNVTKDVVLAGAPNSTHLTIASGQGSKETETLNYIAIADAANTEYEIDDELQRTIVWYEGNVLTESWFNVTKGTNLTAPALNTEYRIFAGASNRSENAVSVANVYSTGVVPSGAYQVSIANTGLADGVVGAATLPVGYSIEFLADAGDWLSQIAYDATGTEFIVSIVQTVTAGAIAPEVYAPTIMNPLTTSIDFDASAAAAKTTPFSSIGPAGNHAQTVWEVYADVGLANLIATTTITTGALTEWDMSSVGLLAATTYYARAKHVSSLALESAWSAISSFTTADVAQIVKPSVLNVITEYSYGQNLKVEISPYAPANSLAPTYVDWTNTPTEYDIEIYSDNTMSELIGTHNSGYYYNVANPSFEFTLWDSISTIDFEKIYGYGKTPHFRVRYYYVDTVAIYSEWSDLFTPGEMIRPFVVQVPYATAETYYINIAAVEPGAKIVIDNVWDSTIPDIPLAGPQRVSLPAPTATGYGTHMDLVISGVTHIQGFEGTTTWNREILIKQWGDTRWTSLNKMFYAIGNSSYGIPYIAHGERYFSSAVGVPDLSLVTDLSGAFAGAEIGYEWDTTGVGNFTMEGWDTSNVTDMSYMFEGAEFKTSRSGTVYVSNEINLKNLDLSSVTTMEGMFKDADFGSNWASLEGSTTSSALTNMHAFASGSYGTKILGLDSFDTSGVTDMSYAFFDLRYADIGSAWMPAIDSWDTSSVTDFSFFWANARFNDLTTVFTNGKLPTFSNISLASATTIESMLEAGFQDTYVQISNIGSWGMTSACTNATEAFKGQKALTGGDLTGWNTSGLTTTYGMFDNCEAFNGDVSNWDVSNVINMGYMFTNCKVFNSDISGWNVSNVEDFSSMFYGNTVFNQDISGWDISKGEAFSAMFALTQAFNQDISGWAMPAATTSGFDFYSMFNSASAFNQDLSSWDLSSVTGGTAPFYFDDNATAWVLPRPIF